MLGCARAFSESFDAPDFEVGFGKNAEEFRQFRFKRINMGRSGVDIVLRACIIIGKIELVVLAHKGEEVAKGSGETDPGLDLFHFRPDARHFAQADIVNLVSGQIGCRVHPEPVIVIGLAIGECAGALGILIGVFNVAFKPRYDV